MTDIEVLTGKDCRYIDFDSAEAPLHEEVVGPFLMLQEMAKAAGFDLAIASSYRDYDRQAAIWNGKLSGVRPVFDSYSERISLVTLSPLQQIEAVLRWSALPGASRHHWGSDIDVYDRGAVAEDYAVQLTTEEATHSGPFASMHDWLDQVLVERPELGFFRPYAKDRGGIAPERWHLSYAPLAARYQQACDVEVIKRCCGCSDILLKETVLANIERLYKRYVNVPIDYYPKQFHALFH
ncbi:MAG: LAS superfamily LD-carboxypeptidase LdcB [Pseudohongiellaceae bacterium]|jgi:LAS superfamily LD-carboxypeptidase LdcB